MAYSNFIDSTFVTQTANQTLTNAFALTSLSSTGTLEADNSTGALSVNVKLTSLGGLTPAAGQVVVGASATTYTQTATGTSGQFLQSNGAALPTWATPPLMPIAAGNVSVGAPNQLNPTATITTPTVGSLAGLTTTSKILLSYTATGANTTPDTASWLPHGAGNIVAGTSFVISLRGTLDAAVNVSYVVYA